MNSYGTQILLARIQALRLGRETPSEVKDTYTETAIHTELAEAGVQEPLPPEE